MKDKIIHVNKKPKGPWSSADAGFVPGVIMVCEHHTQGERVAFIPKWDSNRIIYLGSLEAMVGWDYADKPLWIGNAVAVNRLEVWV